MERLVAWELWIKLSDGEQLFSSRLAPSVKIAALPLGSTNTKNEKVRSK